MAKTITKTESKSTTTLKVKPEDRNLRKDIRTFKESIDTSWIEISQLLPEVYDKELYKSWGFETFENYLLADLELEYRVGMHYYHIGKTIHTLKLKKSDIQGLGWTKLKDLVSLVSEDTSKEEFLEFINKAKDMSCEEVKTMVRQERSEKKTVVQKVKMTFILTNEQAPSVDEALTLAKNLADTESDDVALEYMAIWFTINQNDKNSEDVKKELHTSVAESVEKMKHKKHANTGKTKAPKKEKTVPTKASKKEKDADELFEE